MRIETHTRPAMTATKRSTGLRVMLSIAIAYSGRPAQAARDWDRVAVRAPHLSTGAFRGISRSLPSTVPLSTYLEANGATAEQIARLARAFEDAQRAFLGGDLEESRRAFAKVTNLSLTADWTHEARASIHDAFLRLAQLARDPNEMELQLTAAATFAPDLNADPALFPPPLREKYEATKNVVSKRSETLDARSAFENYEILRINGRSHSLRSPGAARILLPPGTHRITLLSDSHPPLTVTATSTQLRILKTPATPLVEGSCSNPKTTSGFPNLQNASVLLIYETDCAYITSETGKIEPALQSLRLTEPRSRIVASGNRSESSSFDKMIHSPSGEIAESQPLTQKPWFWAGLAAVIATSTVVMLKANQRRDHVAPSREDVRPSQTEGF